MNAFELSGGRDSAGRWWSGVQHFITVIFAGVTVSFVADRGSIVGVEEEGWDAREQEGNRE